MNEGNGIITRVAVLESKQSNVLEDIHEIKKDLAELKRNYNLDRQGFTRGEKLILSGLGVTASSTIIAAIALIVQAPG